MMMMNVPFLNTRLMGIIETTYGELSLFEAEMESLFSHSPGQRWSRPEGSSRDDSVL